MDRQKDLFDLFKENSKQIKETPTPRTWRRLERKLDAHRRRNQADHSWTLSMAAALVGLVCLVGLLSYSYQSGFQKGIALEEPAPRVFEVLEVNEQESQLASRKIIEYQRHFSERGSEIIKEGSRTQRLMPAIAEAEIGD